MMYEHNKLVERLMEETWSVQDYLKKTPSKE
jgi:hypothetical protein